MYLRPFLFIALSATFVISACGARSSLFVSLESSSATGGDGGDGDGGDGGDGGAGGAGGVNPTTVSVGGGGGHPECPALMMDLVAPISLAGGNNFHQREPKLTLVGAQQDQITVASGWTVVEGPAPLPSELRHTTFQAFTAWPTGDIGPTYLADFDGGVSFDVEEFNGGFTMLLSDGGSPSTFLEGMYFLQDMVPGQGDVGLRIPIDTSADTAHFLHAGDGELLAGFEGPSNGNRELRITNLTPMSFGTAFNMPVAIGCASSAMSAGGVLLGSGAYLVATSTSASFVPCDGSPPGVDEVLNVMLVDQALQITDEKAWVRGEFVQVRVAPRSDGGAWIAASYNAPSSDDVILLRVDSDGTVQFEEIAFASLANSEPIASTLELTTMGAGDHALLGWEQADGDNSSTRFTMVNDDGEIVAATLHSQPSRLSDLLGSPEATMAVAGFTETLSSGRDRVRLHRIECVFAE